ncbi:MAG: hypothetical protein Q8K85_03640, partial [Hyphomicrobium sp.]|nr:hypothetical protein [Hyphomicrobium sp.]
MLTRVAIFFGLTVALVAGAFAVDDRTNGPRLLLGAIQVLGAMQAQAQSSAPLPGENTPPDAKPIEPAAPPAIADQPAAPAVIAPPPDAPAPVVTAPPQTPAPVVVAPVPEPEPVVVAPTPLPPEKPAIAEDKKETPAAAKLLFAAKQLPSIGKAVAIGYYPRGC